MIHDLMEAAPYLALIGLGAGLLLPGRDRSDANEHDLSDYHEPFKPGGYVTDAVRRSLRDVEAAFNLLGPPPAADFTSGRADDILPPAPEGMNAGSPLYAGMLFDTWHPEDADAVAARWLRELGEQARTAVAR